MFKSIKIKILIPILLLTALVLPSTASALISDVAEVGACAAMNIIASTAIQRVVDRALGLLNSAIDAGLKFISFGILGGPEQVEVTNPEVRSVQAKELIKDPLARCIARQILNRMNQGIINLTRTAGRDGGPAFVQNWRNFQLESQHRGEDVFRGVLSSTKLCNYFDGNIKETFGATRRVNLGQTQTRVNDFDSFALRAGCTLPNDFNFESYEQDFSANGGWEAWSRLVEPQNNYYGVLFMSLDEANRQRAVEEAGDIYETQGHGFTSKRGDNAAQSCKLAGPSGKCLVFNEVETPASILQDLSAESLKSEIYWIPGVDEMNEIIMNMFNVLINRLRDLGGKRNLTETAPPIEGDPGLDENLPSFENQYPSEESGDGGGGGNSGSSGPCASQEEIAQFLINNPGDEGRLSSAFPCP